MHLAMAQPGKMTASCPRAPLARGDIPIPFGRPRIQACGQFKEPWQSTAPEVQKLNLSHPVKMTASCARARRWPGGYPNPFWTAPDTSVWSIQGAVAKYNLRVTLVTLRDRSLRRHGHPGSHRFVLTGCSALQTATVPSYSPLSGII